MIDTMAFFMRFLLNARRFFALAATLACFSLAVWQPAAHAATEGIQVKSASLKLDDETYLLNAQFAIKLSATLEDALKKGVALNFSTEFEFKRPRWYWFNEDIVKLVRNTRLSYNPLLRQYLLSDGAQLVSFDSLDEVLAALSQIKDWPVLDRRLLSKTIAYQASLGMRLDVSRLPKPLQINAISSNKWELESAPFEWSMTP
jgi:hypothetical protein